MDGEARWMESLKLFHEELNAIPEEQRATAGCLDPGPPPVKLDRRLFCFTGQMLCGEREDIAEMIEVLGARWSRNVVSDLDYLVVGSIASAGWKHGNYGNKIVKALEEKERRKETKWPGPAIISEEHFVTEILKQYGLR